MVSNNTGGNSLVESCKLHHEVARNVADDGHNETVTRDVAEVGANSTSATVAHNLACNNFKGGHMVQLSSCAQCCVQCCAVCPGLKVTDAKTNHY